MTASRSRDTRGSRLLPEALLLLATLAGLYAVSKVFVQGPVDHPFVAPSHLDEPAH